MMIFFLMDPRKAQGKKNSVLEHMHALADVVLLSAARAVFTRHQAGFSYLSPASHFAQRWSVFQVILAQMSLRPGGMGSSNPGFVAESLCPHEAERGERRARFALQPGLQQQRQHTDKGVFSKCAQLEKAELRITVS